MINLYSYMVFENDIESLSSMLASLNDLSSLLDAINSVEDKMGSTDDSRKLRLVNNILNNLLSDPDIIDWANDPASDEYNLRRILKNKLSPREARYFDEICQKMLELGNSGNSARINNLTTELLVDPEIGDWYSSNGNRMDLIQILAKKLKGSDRKFIQQISQNIYNICGRQINTMHRKYEDN